MELDKKLKIYAVISFLGLVLMIVAYVSPGWGVVEIVQRKAHPTDEPFFLEKRDADRWHHHRHHRHHDDKEVLRMQLGLWYFVLCGHNCGKKDLPPPQDYVIDDIDMPKEAEKEDGPHHRKGHRCHVKTYFHYLEPDPNYSYVWDNVEAIKEIGKRGACEFRVMATTGLILGLIGFFFSLVYKRRMTQARRSGLTAFICMLVAGVLYMVTVGKLVTVMQQYKATMPALFMENGMAYLRFGCPWGLILAGISAVLLLISATGHLCIMTRDSSESDIRVYRLHTGNSAKHSFTTIAPPGYDASVGLKVPLTQAMEAEPLPEKEKV